MNKKTFHARLLATQLANECYQRDNKAENTANGGYDGTIRQETLSAALADKAAVMYQRLSLVGYLKLLTMLLKIALTNKIRHGKTPVFWGIVAE